MNKRHLKFKMETGYWPTDDIRKCEEDFEQAYKYIQWLEEQNDEQEQLLKIAIDLFPDTNEELKIKYFEKNKDQK